MTSPTSTTNITQLPAAVPPTLDISKKHEYAVDLLANSLQLTIEVIHEQYKDYDTVIMALVLYSKERNTALTADDLSEYVTKRWPGLLKEGTPTVDECYRLLSQHKKESREMVKLIQQVQVQQTQQLAVDCQTKVNPHNVPRVSDSESSDDGASEQEEDFTATGSAKANPPYTQRRGPMASGGRDGNSLSGNPRPFGAGSPLRTPPLQWQHHGAEPSRNKTHRLAITKRTFGAPLGGIPALSRVNPYATTSTASTRGPLSPTEHSRTQGMYTGFAARNSRSSGGGTSSLGSRRLGWHKEERLGLLRFDIAINTTNCYFVAINTTNYLLVLLIHLIFKVGYCY